MEGYLYACESEKTYSAWIGYISAGISITKSFFSTIVTFETDNDVQVEYYRQRKL
jgi:hypothetical protein